MKGSRGGSIPPHATNQLNPTNHGSKNHQNRGAL